MAESWDECSPWTQALIIGYNQRAAYEEARANAPSKPPPASKGKSGGGKRRGGRR